MIQLYKKYIFFVMPCMAILLFFTLAFTDRKNVFAKEAPLSDTSSFSFPVGSVVLTQKDSMTDEVIPDALFDLYQFNDLTGQFQYYKRLTFNKQTQNYESDPIYVADTNSQARFYIKETQCGNNYINDWNGEEFCLTEHVFNFEFLVESQPILGSLTVKKNGEYMDSFQNSQFIYHNSIPLEGVLFSLFADSDIYQKDKILFKKGQKIVDFATDQYGIAKVTDLPMGSYFFKESKTPAAYQPDSGEYRFSITRDENRKYSEKTFDLCNVLKKCTIDVYNYFISTNKEDNKLPLPGTCLGLYCKEKITDMNKGVILEKDSLIAESVTDKNGKIIFKELPYADYYIKELKVPEGYILNDGIVDISKEQFQLECTPGAPGNNQFLPYEKRLDIVNQKQLFCLKIHKSGDCFTDIEKQNTENGEYFQYEIGTKPLEKVLFALYAEDGSFISRKETDSSGIAEFSGLEQSTYYYMEESCPDAYSMDTEKHKVIIKPDSENQLEQFVHNSYCSVSLSLTKSGESVSVLDNQLAYKTVPLTNIVFGLYQDFEYTFPSGTAAAKNTCLGYIVTKEDGLGDYSGRLPEGRYYLKELKTAENYVLDTNLYYFTVKAEKHKPIRIQIENNNQMTARLAKAPVRVTTTDADNGMALKGVEFTLYNEQAQIIGFYKTDGNGKIQIDALPYGSYYFVESKAKKGYYASNNKYQFYLSSTEGVVLNILNYPVLKLGFHEHYQQTLLILISVIAGICGTIFMHIFKWRR